MTKGDAYLYQIIFQIRTCFPKSQVFYLLNLIIKSFGLYLCTHNIKGLESNNMTLHKIISQLIIVKSSSPQLYEIVSFVFFIFLLLYSVFIIFLLLYNKHKAKKKPLSQLNEFVISKHKISSSMSLVIQAFTIILLFFSFFNQHIIEMLFISIYSLFLQMQKEQELFSITKQNTNQSLIGYIPLGFFNIISIILMAFYSFCFMILSIKKSELVEIGYKPHCSIIGIVILFINVFIQGIFGITELFERDRKIMIRMIIAGVLVFILFADFMSDIRRFNINRKSLISRTMYYIKLLCLYSCIIELITYFTINADISQQMSSFKQLLEVCLVIATVIINHYILERKHINDLSSDLFLHKMKSKISYEHLMTYFNLLLNYYSFDSIDNFHSIYTIIQSHIIQCSNDECPCRTISSFNDALAKSSLMGKIEKLSKEIIMIGEQEINSLIAISLTEKQTRYLDRLCLLHIDYLALIKNNFVFAFYISHAYYTTPTNNFQWSFISKYHLYEIRLILLKSFVKKQKTIQSRLTIRKLNIISQTSSLSLVEVIPLSKYLITCNTLFKGVYNCIHNLERIINYLSFSNLKNNQSSSREIIDLFNDNAYWNNRLLTIFTNNYSNKGFKSIEINYLINSYLLLVYGQIPLEYQEILDQCSSYQIVEKERIQYNSFPEGSNSIICEMQNDDWFKIIYLSLHFCEEFNWSHDKAINQNFNLFLPFDFGQHHNSYMKIFALFDNSSYKKNTFILDNNDLLLNVNIVVKKYLRLSNGFNFILLLVKNEPLIEEIGIMPPSKPINCRVLLDNDLNVAHIDQTFESSFYFTSLMFTRLKLNFCDFFGINKNKVLNDFLHKVKTQEIPKYHIDDISKNNRVYHNVGNNSIFLYRGLGFQYSICYKSIVLNDVIYISKKDFYKTINQLQHFVKNFNVENNILDKIEELNNYFQHVKYQHQDGFKITLTLKKIGIVYYYIALIEENIVHNCHIIESMLPLSTHMKTIDRFKINKNSISMNMNLSVVDHHSQMHLEFRLKGEKKPKEKKLLSTKNKNKITSSTMRFLESNNMNTNTNASNTDKSSNQTKLKLLNNQSLSLFNKNNQKNLMNSKIEQSTCGENLFKSLKKYSLDNLILIIVLIQVVSFVFNALYYFSSLELSRKVFMISYSFYQLKSDLTFSSLLFIRQCLVKEGINSIDTPDLMWKFRYQSELLLIDLNKALLQINELHYHSDISKIYQVFYSTSSYTTLKDNWEETTYNATIHEEIYRLHYYFSIIYQSNIFSQCRVKEYANNDIWKLLFRTPVIEEKVLHYIITNTQTTLIDQLNEFSEISQGLYTFIHKRSNRTYVIMSFITLVLCFLLYSLLIIKLLVDKYTIKSRLLKIYIMGNDDTYRLQHLIVLLKIMSKAFNKENCLTYEKELTNPYIHKLDNTKETKIERLISEYPNIFDKKTDNASDEEANGLFRLSFENMKHYSNLTEIPLVNKTLYVSSIFFIANISLCITLLIIINMNYQTLFYDKDIGLNIIGKIPLFAQMVLYYINSVIVNDAYYIPRDNTDYLMKTFNYYQVSIDINSESIFTRVFNSNYGLLYYKLLFTQVSLEKYFADESNTALYPECIYWNNLFNRKNEFAIFASMGYVKYSLGCTSHLNECFDLINEYSKHNLYVKNNLALNEMNTLFDMMTKELNGLFLDFEKSGITTNKDLLYLLSYDFWIILENTIRIMNTANDVLYSSLLIDIKNSYSNEERDGLLYSFLLIAFSLITMGICIFIIIYYLKKHIDTIEKVGKKIWKLKKIHSIE